MGNYYSPTGNYEVWEEKPEGYFTLEEWRELHPPEPPKPPTIEELTQQFIARIQLRLDMFAQTRGYDGILSACSYAISNNPVFHVEGQYCMDKRDETWTTAHTILNDVIAVNRPILTWEEIEAELPALEWPIEGGDNR